MNEIDSNAAIPLQAVKLLALYLSNPHDKVADEFIKRREEIECVVK
ncbi:coatomer subunit epsilon-1 isoform 2 [Corchorus olitorius]|uniref:Coatomer subunit epsilon-1 isoform 2 n=1 Tax=Corchorus olitorius TaxID=93759 RepID=A0A1R3FVS9_9ROSI|nr:coatomer subunit epsilon-1 isoform 2 [Corchorus olitorius]